MEQIWDYIDYLGLNWWVKSVHFGGVPYWYLSEQLSQFYVRTLEFISLKLYSSETGPLATVSMPTIRNQSVPLLFAKPLVRSHLCLGNFKCLCRYINVVGVRASTTYYNITESNAPQWKRFLCRHQTPTSLNLTPLLPPVLDNKFQVAFVLSIRASKKKVICTFYLVLLYLLIFISIPSTIFRSFTFTINWPNVISLWGTVLYYHWFFFKW